jgi:hypothetical protein
MTADDREVVRISYAEISNTVSVRGRHLEFLQVLRSELYGLARCVKQTSNEQQFLGVFLGAAVAFLISAVTPGAETAIRLAFGGLAALSFLASAYLYRKSKGRRGRNQSNRAGN